MTTANTPGSRLRTVLSILAAVFCGSAIGTAITGTAYSELPSYFGSDPLTCANCHVMQDYYDAWSQGPHARAGAVCNDCHLPHNGGFFTEYGMKAEDGFLHVYAFLTDNYPENIVIRESSLAVVNAACLNCHEDMTSQIRGDVPASGVDRTTVTCSRCHSTTGHK